MNTMHAIMTRRSIRRYRSEAVSEEQVKLLLRAGMAAPSAGNQQPWDFVVVDDRPLLEKIRQAHPHAEMLGEAPLALVVCGDTQREKHAGYWVQDCAAATENILLAAHALGLGACWLGVHPRAERVAALQEMLGLPEHVHPLCVIALGYAAEQPAPDDRFDKSRSHRNRW